MSTFGSVAQARMAGFEICRVDEDGILVRHRHFSGAVRFGWVPRPARFVRGTVQPEAPTLTLTAAPSKKASFWFPF